MESDLVLMAQTDEDLEFDVPFPLEVLIRATAVSDQTKNRKGRANWIKEVGNRVQERIYTLVDWYSIRDRPLMATIYYFSPSPMDGDVDNIVKPILDGMIGIAYKSDQHIEKVVV